MKKHHFLSLFLTLSLVLALSLTGIFATRAQAAEVLASGTCGDNLTWTLDGDGVLTISGTGEMENYSFHSSAPWYAKQAEITSVVIEDGVTSIGSDAFYKCYKLTSITIPDGVTSIGDCAFCECVYLMSVNIPDSVTSIGLSAFSCCYRLTNITIPDSVTSIGESAFLSCHDLTSVTIGENVATIGDYAFQDCSSLTSITIPASVTYIGRDAFHDCTSLTDVHIYGAATIDEYAFHKCSSLSSVILEEGVTRIGPSAFAYCEKMKTITIPKSVTYIEKYAFAHCYLKDVYYAGSEADWETVGTGWLNEATVHFNSLFIFNQPKDAVVSNGRTAQFSLDAFGSDLSYQWQYQTPTSGKWKNSTASSATTKTLKVTATTARDGRQYRCKITDSEGKVVYTDVVTLHVLGITSQPASVSVTDGTSVKFTVKATGDSVKYQWQYRTSSSGSWKNSGASTAKKATIKISGTTSKNGYQYRCKVTDSAGNVVYSDPATLTVLSAVSVTSQPSDAYITVGETAKFKVKASGDGLTYQWQYRTSSTGSWKDSTASSAITATVKVTGKTSRNGYQYRCKVTDSAGNVVYSEPATLYVLGIKTQPVSQTVSAGTSVKFTVKATGDGLVYQWQYRTSSSGSWKNSGASTATKATIKINGTTSKNGYQYRCKITDSAGNVIYSDAATLTVN